MNRILDTFPHWSHCIVHVRISITIEEYNKTAKTSCSNGNGQQTMFRGFWVAWQMLICAGIELLSYWLFFHARLSRSNTLQWYLYSEVTFFIQSSTRLFRHLINDQAVHSSTQGVHYGSQKKKILTDCNTLKRRYVLWLIICIWKADWRLILTGESSWSDQASENDRYLLVNCDRETKDSYPFSPSFSDTHG